MDSPCRVVESPELYVNVFGGFALRDAGGRSIAVSNRKACGILAYLTLNQHPTEGRERLAGLFWSDRTEANARASLRQCLKQLRTTFDQAGISALDTRRNDITLDVRKVNADVWDVLGHAERRNAHGLLLREKRLTEALLAGFDDLDAEFRVWLVVQRQNLQERIVRSLEDCLSETGNADVPAETARVAQALINLDPTHEVACRSLIRAYADQGDVSGALKVYGRLWDHLDDEYGMEPSSQTQDLIVQIKSGEYVARPHAVKVQTQAQVRVAGAASPHGYTPPLAVQETKLTLVVGSFDGRHIPDEQQYLCWGFRHDLIASLVRFREWSIIDDEEQTFSAARNGSSDDKYAIDAQFRSFGEDLYVTLNLKELATNVVIWSDRHSLVGQSPYSAHQYIIRRIAVALNVHLSVERLSRVVEAPDVSMAVYDRWLYGQSLTLEWRPEVREHARSVFQTIIAENPEFGAAYSSLVQIENSDHFVFPGLFRSIEREKKALELAKTAVRVDPLDSRTQLSLAWSYALNGMFDRAARNHMLAYELNENDPWTIVSAAMGLTFCGHYEEGRRLADQALALDLRPTKSHWGYQTSIRYLCGDFEQAAAAAESAGTAMYDLSAWHAAALAQLGRKQEAEKVARRFLADVRANWCGTDNPSDENIAAWFMQCFPIRDSSALDSLRTGIREAGIPAPELN